MTAIGVVAKRGYVSDSFWSSGTQWIRHLFGRCHLGQGSVGKTVRQNFSLQHSKQVNSISNWCYLYPHWRRTPNLDTINRKKLSAQLAESFPCSISRTTLSAQLAE